MPRAIVSVIVGMLLAIFVAGRVQSDDSDPKHISATARIPITRPNSAGLQADYLLLVRIPANGTTDGLFVRYYVTRDQIKFVVLDVAPNYLTSSFPIYPRTLGGEFDRNSARMWHDHFKINIASDSSERRTTPLSASKLTYNPRELRFAPAEFTPLFKADFQLGDGIDSGQIGSPVTVEGRLPDTVTVGADGTVQSSHRWYAGSTLPRVAEYSYVGTGSSQSLTRLRTRIVPQRFLIPSDDNFQVAVSIEWQEQQTILGKTGTNELTFDVREMPYTHHRGGRETTVDFQVRSVGADFLSSPDHIRVARPGGVIPFGQDLRSAYCLSVTTLTRQEVDVCFQRDFRPDLSWRDSFVETQAFRDSNYQSAPAQAEVKRWQTRCVQLLADANAPLHCRLHWLNRLTRAARYQNNPAEADRCLRTYFDEVCRSPLRRACIEIGYNLLHSLSVNYTDNYYRAALVVIREYCQSHLSRQEILDACLHLRTRGVAPYTLYQIAELARPPENSAADSRTDDDRILDFFHCYMVASLIPSMRIAISEKADQYFIEKDIIALRSNLTEPRIDQLAEETLQDATRILQALPPELQTALRDYFKPIPSWTSAR